MSMSASLGELLLKEGHITTGQLHDALEHQKTHGGSLGQILLSLGFLQQEQLSETLAKQSGILAIDPSEAEINPNVLGVVPQGLAERLCIIPINFRDSVLQVAMADPTNVSALDEIRFALGHFEPVFATRAAIQEAIAKHYGERRNVEATDIELEQLERCSDDPLITKLCNLILVDAVRRGANEIHVEPLQQEYRIRFRVDGVLSTVMNPPLKLRRVVGNRFKMMAKINTSETRLPQSGHISIQFNFKGEMRAQEYELHTSPTQWGERLFLQLYDSTPIDSSDLAFDEKSLTEEQVVDAVAWKYDLPSLPSSGLDVHGIDPTVISLVPAETARQYQVLPLAREGASLYVAMADPTNMAAIDDIRFRTGCYVEPIVASEEIILQSIDKYYGAPQPRTDVTHKDAPDERERPRTRSPHRDRTLKAAEKYVARGKVDKALVEYDKWVVANPDDWTTIRRMGDLYARIGRKEEAVKMYARVAEQFREGGFRVRAISTEKVILRLDPENARAQQSLAEMLVIQGLGLEAAHQYERLVDLYTKQGQREKADAARRALQKLRSNAPD